MNGQLKKLFVITITALLLAAGCSSKGTGMTPKTPQDPAPAITVTFEGGKCAYAGPKTVPSGQVINVTMDVKDQDKVAYAVYFMSLDAGKTFDDLKEAAMKLSAPPSWAHTEGASEGGLPGKINTFTTFITKGLKGPLYLLCFSKPPDNLIGSYGPIEASQ
jgi:hypothetical protein